jgi:hypothetical protein
MPRVWRKPMAKILELQAGDYWGCKVKDILDFVDVGPIDPDDDAWGEGRPVDFYDQLKAKMAKDRINKIPLCVRDGSLDNGHHRVKLAVEIGLSEMLVTNDFTASGYDDCYGEVY